MDLAPTIAELFGVAWPADGEPLTTGRSLLALIDSSHAALRAHAVTVHGVSIGVRSSDWHWRRSSPSELPQLFVKPDDRWEFHDVRAQNEAVAEEMERYAVQFQAHGVSPEAR